MVKCSIKVNNDMRSNFLGAFAKFQKVTNFMKLGI
jgi:hypothetical protein